MIGLYRFYSFIYLLVIFYRVPFFIYHQGWFHPILLFSFLFSLITLVGVFGYAFRLNLKEHIILKIIPFTTLLSELYFLWEATRVSPFFALIDLALSATAVYTIFLYLSRLSRSNSSEASKNQKRF